MSGVEEMSPTYDFSAYCEEGGTFGLYVDVAGQQRFGPSLCMLNSFFAPVVLIALAVLGGTRISELKRLPDVKPYTHFHSVFDTAQFGLAAAGTLLGMASGVMASERADVSSPLGPKRSSEVCLCLHAARCLSLLLLCRAATGFAVHAALAHPLVQAMVWPWPRDIGLSRPNIDILTCPPPPSPSLPSCDRQSLAWSFLPSFLASWD